MLRIVAFLLKVNINSYFCGHKILKRTKMKKIILIAAAIAASVSSYAQVSVGAGYLNDASKSVYTINKTSTENKTNSNGFYVQGMYGLPIVSSLNLNAGLKFSYLTNTESGNLDAAGVHLADATKDTKEMYLALPVLISYGVDITKDFSASLFAGPTFSLGLSSKSDVTTTVLGQSKTTNYDNYAKDDDGNASSYKRGNIFVGGGLNVDFRDMIRLTIGYDFGLLNRTTVDNTKLTQNQFFVGVSYLF